MSVRIVIDIDDTLCTNVRKLSYDKCEPKKEVIEKINYLHDVNGYNIVLYTSRGMISCNGDMEKIVAKNEAVLKDWLIRNEVHYDELIFGKPIADMYVDDKALDVKDFVKAPFGELCGGGSGKQIERLAHIVKKDLGTKEDTERFKDWIEDNTDSCKYPKIISYLYNEVYMEYINGTNLCECFGLSDLYYLLHTVENFKSMKKNTFDMDLHIDVLKSNFSDDEEFNKIIKTCISLLDKQKATFLKNASYSHGDMILSNVLKRDTDYYFIDCRYFRSASSYLLDLGKLRMSLMGYEKEFNLSKADNTILLPYLDRYLKSEGIYRTVLITTLMYICRLHRYKTVEERGIVLKMAKDVLKEIMDV